MSETRPFRAFRRPIGVFSVVMACLAAGSAAAQEPLDPSEAARYRFGPLGLNPRFAIRDIGIDSNVFNAAGEPQEDFTATLSSELEALLRVGRLYFAGTTASDYVFFREFKDERSVNKRAGGRIEARLGVIRPNASIDLAQTRERQGYEIDERAQREERTLSVGMDVRMSSITGITLSARRSRTDFADGETFRGVNLDSELNRDVETFSAGLRFVITPLTTMLTLAELQRDRFARTSTRDSETLRGLVRFEFSPDAGLTGTASVGYREFKTERPDLPDYVGAIAVVTVAYTVAESTRFNIRFDRDVGYSFEPVQPYFISTGGGLVITQRVFGPMDVVARTDRQRLNYRSVGGLAEGRLDSITTFGVGLGFRIREDLRFGINAERAERRSTTLATAAFDRTRIFGTLTYGL